MPTLLQSATRHLDISSGHHFHRNAGGIFNRSAESPPLHLLCNLHMWCSCISPLHWLPYFLLAVMPPAAVSAHDDVVVEVAIVEEAVGGESLSRCSPLLFPCLSFLLSFYSMRCLFIGVSSCCSNQIRFHFHQFHPTFLSYYMQCSFRHEKTLFSPSDFEQRFRQTFLISD